MIRRRDAILVSLGVAVALVTRLITNVLTRPEFVGWFNHSTYYSVQTRSLIQDGQLAYEDMPLLFVLYANLAQFGSWAGQPLEEAIVTTTRLVMAITPALIPVAAYCLARCANTGREIRWPTWCLIFASGFLPLTYANMPETLQKNMMGLLLLSLAFVALFRWLAEKSIARLLVALILMAIIVLVHLGSALAAILLVAAVTLELLFSASSRRPNTRLLIFSISVAAAVLIGINVLYPSAMGRIRALADAFVPENGLSAVVLVAVLAGWLGAMWFIWRWMARKASGQDLVVARLMRIVVFWTCLLVLPLWPGEIGMRLLLFIPLALVVLLILLLSQIQGSRWLTVACSGTALVFASMSVGETVSMLMIYPNKDEIALELSNLRQKYQLERDDLIITTYGVNPTANWFLGTRASLLTAVNQNVFELHNRIFVLNTLERPAPTLVPGSCKTTATEQDRYWTTRHDVPLSAETADPEFETFGSTRSRRFPRTGYLIAAARGLAGVTAGQMGVR